MAFVVPIFDTHIHLYPLSEASTLAWNSPGHPLWSQHSLSEYKAATASSYDILGGFIFVETDRKVDDEEPDTAAWTHPLAEVSFFARIAAGKPRAGEGHAPGHPDVSMCQGLVAWAPLPAGREALGKYLERVRGVCERDGDAETWGKVRGVRYLLQDKPDGTMLEDGFVESVRELGVRGLGFDVGVDLHRRGTRQLEEVVELVRRAHEGRAVGEKTVFVLNHLCKPDLTMLDPSSPTTFDTSNPTFAAWREAMFTLGAADNVYMKLSGCFSEMSPALANAHPNVIFDALAPWLAVVAAAFGPARLMFGSDWPICTVGIDGGGEKPWDKWRLVVDRFCLASQFSRAETKMVFFDTGRRAYGVEGRRQTREE